MRFELNVDSFKVTPRVSDLSLKREDFDVTSLITRLVTKAQMTIMFVKMDTLVLNQLC